MILRAVRNHAMKQNLVVVRIKKHRLTVQTCLVAVIAQNLAVVRMESNQRRVRMRKAVKTRPLMKVNGLSLLAIMKLRQLWRVTVLILPMVVVRMERDQQLERISKAVMLLTLRIARLRTLVAVQMGLLQLWELMLKAVTHHASLRLMAVVKTILRQHMDPTARAVV